MNLMSEQLRLFFIEDINLRMARFRGPPRIQIVGLECNCEDGSCRCCSVLRAIKRILYRHDN